MLKPMVYSYIRFSASEQSRGDSICRQTELSAYYRGETSLTLDDSLPLVDASVSAVKGANRTAATEGSHSTATDPGGWIDERPETFYLAFARALHHLGTSRYHRYTAGHKRTSKASKGDSPMYINEAAQQFIDSHKPEKIDVDRIKQSYTRVEGYLASLAQRTEDKQGYYVEISGADSITGQPIRVQWKPMSDKMRA
jgi:hypothetical protein